jgi:hypothetical protein
LDEAIQARQRRKPVRCWFSGKKVLLWDQEAIQARQVLLWDQEAIQARQVLLWDQEASNLKQDVLKSSGDIVQKTRSAKSGFNLDRVIHFQFTKSQKQRQCKSQANTKTKHDVHKRSLKTNSS